MQLKLRTNRQRRFRGQGMVEFALAFPIFLLIIMGIIEFGRLFVIYTSVYAAAREGARYGAAVDNLCNGQLAAEAKRAGFMAEPLTVSTVYEVFDKDLKLVSRGTACNVSNLKAGDRVVVTTSTPFQFITGFIHGPGGGPIVLQSTAKRSIIKKVYLDWTLAPASTSDPASTPAVPNTPGPGATATPTNGPTPTPTPLPKCDNTSITGYTSSTSPYTVTLYNNSAIPFDITQIAVYWEKPASDLVKLSIAGNGTGDSWTGDISKSPAIVDLVSYHWTINNGSSYVTITFDPIGKDAKFKGVTFNMIPHGGSECTIP